MERNETAPMWTGAIFHVSWAKTGNRLLKVGEFAQVYIGAMRFATIKKSHAYVCTGDKVVPQLYPIWNLSMSMLSTKTKVKEKLH